MAERDSFIYRIEEREVTYTEPKVQLLSTKSDIEKIGIALLFAISIIVLIAVTPTSMAAYQSVSIGVSKGDIWSVTCREFFEEGNWTYTYTYSVLNVNATSVWLNVSYKYEQEGEAGYYDKVYNFSEIGYLLEWSLLEGEPLPLLPINWSLVNETLESLIGNFEEQNITINMYETKELLGDKYVTEILFEMHKNATNEIVHAVMKYSKHTGIILNFQKTASYLHDDTWYNYTIIWSLNPDLTTIHFWDFKYVESVKTSTAVATTTGSIAGAVAGIASVAVSSLSSTVAATPSAVATPSIPVTSSETAGYGERKPSLRYLKYLSKLRKLIRRKKKTEIKPPTNSIPFTILCAAMGALAGGASILLVPSTVFGTVPLISIISASAGFALAGAGISLFVRRYVFFKRKSLLLSKREKIMLLSILIGGIYGATACPLSLLSILQAAVPVIIPITAPLALIVPYTYISLQEIR